ncbi:trace amine-associated receptor 5-like [Protopterus annectens]|uniref:trace amine-associated receptor 5-like n=1 Tax=Protopterus annectens TaxID=7888 RepID=UPI001CF9B601|nr:trace amine-associated receptor 5-like [Protopterus annectens]
MNTTFLLVQKEEVHLCYENENTSCVKLFRPSGVKSALYFIFFLGTLLTIVGNLAVVVSVAHFRVLHSPPNVLILSLAVADFLLGLLVLPFSSVRSVETCWYFGDYVCKLHTCVDSVLCLVAIFHLCFISIDRYYAICDPLLYTTKVTIPSVCIYIFSGWILSIVYTSFWIYSHVLEENMQWLMSAEYCMGSCDLIYNKIWAWINFPLFFIPCFLTIGLYLKVYFVAQRQSRMIEATRDLAGFSPQTRASKRERKAAKTLGIAVGLYLLCSLPFMTDSLIDPFIGYVTPPLLFDILFWLPYYNSACNPFIYGFFYPWFRKALKHIFTCKIFYSGSSSINLYQQ